MSTELDEELQVFLRTPEGREILQRQTPSIVLTLLHSIGLAVLGWCCCCTVILIWPGIKWLWRGLTLHPMRTAGISASEAAACQAVVCYPIMIGPGEKECPALLVTELKMQRSPEVAEFAQHCYSLYAGDVPKPNEHQLALMLKDDAFQRNRRRAVPKLAAPGQVLYLLDMMVNPEFNHPVSGYAICAATPGPAGVAFQVPFVAVSPPTDR